MRARGYQMGGVGFGALLCLGIAYSLYLMFGPNDEIGLGPVVGILLMWISWSGLPLLVYSLLMFDKRLWGIRVLPVTTLVLIVMTAPGWGFGAILAGLPIIISGLIMLFEMRAFHRLVRSEDLHLEAGTTGEVGSSFARPKPSRASIAASVVAGVTVIAALSLPIVGVDTALSSSFSFYAYDSMETAGYLEGFSILDRPEFAESYSVSGLSSLQGDVSDAARIIAGAAGEGLADANLVDALDTSSVILAIVWPVCLLGTVIGIAGICLSLTGPRVQSPGVPIGMGLMAISFVLPLALPIDSLLHAMPTLYILMALSVAGLVVGIVALRKDRSRRIRARAARKARRDALRGHQPQNSATDVPQKPATDDRLTPETDVPQKPTTDDRLKPATDAPLKPKSQGSGEWPSGEQESAGRAPQMQKPTSIPSGLSASSTAGIPSDATQ